MQHVPSQFLSSSAFLFLLFTSSSFFFASSPSLARFIFIAFRLLTSSSINISRLLLLTIAFHSFPNDFIAGSESGVVLGKGGFISRRRRVRAWLITASISSRRLESESSDSACGMVGGLVERRREDVDVLS